ncbi:hypothetical protein KAM472_26700 [Aeromonas caviae]|nr:hypothetical protein KAM462_25000 [Aeromonas caviae]GKR11700.1 hypothetical protein KAM465_32770 [Aeromonas caviae]GKR15962.1 hypothetical protein KAM466_32800 [Aeromonas caviae]GKR20856.1 hypothetical protein KAM467_39000 [Aeromonas caviae]GKR25178.1 hypothetical protein KAM468_39180 [Aeromonas caviae]
MTTGVSLTKSRVGFSSHIPSDVNSADYTGPAAQLRYWGFAHVVFSGGYNFDSKECEQGAHCNNLSRVTLGQMELA